VLFAYDGSDLARFAIDEGATQLAAGRDAVVVCVWQPVDVGFVITGHIDADDAAAVRTAAEETAAAGASWAEKAGFRARGVAVEAAPAWKGIVDAASECGASLLVVGSQRRDGLVGHLHGAFAASLLAHAEAPVLVVQRQP
jgi:nucleotide-binding universal stress UspA family protein